MLQTTATVQHATEITSHEWTATQALPIASTVKVGKFKRIGRDKKNEMLPLIYFNDGTSLKKLVKRDLTPVEFNQILFHDVWHNEMLYDVTYRIDDSNTHTRIEVANKFNGIKKQFTIH
jgi:hypothetical protein